MCVGRDIEVKYVSGASLSFERWKRFWLLDLERYTIAVSHRLFDGD